MRSLFTACFGLLNSTIVMADKYGIDEINAENEGSWGRSNNHPPAKPGVFNVSRSKRPWRR
jgi:hypothetical protein